MIGLQFFTLPFSSKHAQSSSLARVRATSVISHRTPSGRWFCKPDLVTSFISLSARHSLSFTLIANALLTRRVETNLMVSFTGLARSYRLTESACPQIEMFSWDPCTQCTSHSRGRLTFTLYKQDSSSTTYLKAHTLSIDLSSPCEDLKAIREDSNARYKQPSQNLSPAPRHGFAVGAVIQDQALIRPAMSMVGWTIPSTQSQGAVSAQPAPYSVVSISSIFSISQFFIQVDTPIQQQILKDLQDQNSCLLSCDEEFEFLSKIRLTTKSASNVFEYNSCYSHEALEGTYFQHVFITCWIRTSYH